MPSFLFPRLTPSERRGSALFGTLTGEARRPHWYVEGQAPDTIDGRFAVLATIVALAIVRLENGGEIAKAEAVALTERFVEAMDAEHRQLGIGDPALGKQVRKLVGALSRRVDLLRAMVDHGADWTDAVASSLARGVDPPAEAQAHCEAALRAFWAQIEAAPDDALVDGRIG